MRWWLIYASLLLLWTVTPERSDGSTAEPPGIWLAPPQCSKSQHCSLSRHAIYAHGTEALRRRTGQGKARQKIEEQPGSLAEMSGGALLPVEVEECAFCFEVLSKHFVEPNTGFLTYNGVHSDLSCGIFVTWKRDDVLLGCIGTLSDVSYGSNLGKYAIQAATNDRRFEPISGLHGSLTVTVSRLGDWHTAASWEDWKIGVHGLILRVKIDGCTYTSTFLPEVAFEQSWTKQETLFELISKAGVPSSKRPTVFLALSNPPSATDCIVHLKTYRTSRRTLAYAEYLQLLKQK